MADSTVATNTEYLYPSTINNLTDNTANYLSGIPAWANQVTQNWYNQPLTTGVTPNQQAAIGALTNPDQQWIHGIQGAQGTAGQAVDIYGQNAQYDPNQLAQYLNPYIQGANAATAAESNRNLFEKILPQVNSTFAGTGQFGSTRSADFTNRALRDQQQTLTEALSKANVANYNQANQNYLNWAQQGNQAAAGLTNTASTLGQLAGSGSNIYQQNLNNMMSGATAEQQAKQAGLTANYEDWLKQQQFPLSTMGALGQAASQLTGSVKPTVSTPVAQPDTVSRVLAAVQAISSGLSDASIQGILQELGLGNLVG